VGDNDDADYVFGAPVNQLAESHGGPLVGARWSPSRAKASRAPVSRWTASVLIRFGHDGTSGIDAPTQVVISDTEITVTPRRHHGADGATSLATHVNITFNDAANPDTPATPCPRTPSRRLSLRTGRVARRRLSTQPPTSTTVLLQLRRAGLGRDDDGDVVTGDNTDQFTLSLTPNAGASGARLSCMPIR